MNSEQTLEAEPPYAWFRLAVCLVIATIGGVGMWSVVVVLPYVQAEFGVGRADASLPYLTLTIGLALGGVAMGRLTDRAGIIPPLPPRHGASAATAR